MTSRVTAPHIPEGTKVHGPASYFPSIEKKYGRPVQEWIDHAVARLDAGDQHMEVVTHLKSEHGLGHGHANAVLAYVRSKLAE